MTLGDQSGFPSGGRLQGGRNAQYVGSLSCLWTQFGAGGSAGSPRSLLFIQVWVRLASCGTNPAKQVCERGELLQVGGCSHRAKNNKGREAGVPAVAGAACWRCRGIGQRVVRSRRGDPVPIHPVRKTQFTWCLGKDLQGVGVAASQSPWSPVAILRSGEQTGFFMLAKFS